MGRYPTLKILHANVSNVSTPVARTPTPSVGKRPQADVLTYILGGRSYIIASRSERIVRLPIHVGFLINDKDQDSVINNKLLDGDNNSFVIEISYFVNAIILILP